MYRRAQKKTFIVLRELTIWKFYNSCTRQERPSRKWLHIYIYIHIFVFFPIYQNHIFLSVRKKFMYQRRTEFLIANRDRIHLYTSLLLYRLYLSNILSIIVYQKSENYYYHRQIAIACSAMMSNIS